MITDPDSATTNRQSELDGELDEAFARHRRELTAYSYRMLGSGAEAEDAVQEAMVRAWRAFDAFEGRSSVRSWLYRITTNVCLDMLKAPQRRARPMDLGPASTSDSSLDPGLPEHAWVQPVPDAWVLPEHADPADLVASRQSIRLAFVAALQHLPPRQRAVLILREVLRWQASEVAELLDTTVASVNSALQRARATLDEVDGTEPVSIVDDPRLEALLARYVAAFEAYDMDTLVALLHEEVTFSMPPYALWLRGPEEVRGWMVGTGKGCNGARMVATAANGVAAFGVYRVAGPGVWEPFALQLVEGDGERITGIHSFLYPDRFAEFGLPPRLTAAD